METLAAEVFYFSIDLELPHPERARVTHMHAHTCSTYLHESTLLTRPGKKTALQVALCKLHDFCHRSGNLGSCCLFRWLQINLSTLVCMPIIYLIENFAFWYMGKAVVIHVSCRILEL